MEKNDFYTIPQVAALLGISRIAVYKKVKNGVIPARRVGRTYLIPAGSLRSVLGKKLDQKGKHQIAAAVRKTVKEYGEVLRMLGSE